MRYASKTYGEYMDFIKLFHTLNGLRSQEPEEQAHNYFFKKLRCFPIGPLHNKKGELIYNHVPDGTDTDADYTIGGDAFSDKGLNGEKYTPVISTILEKFFLGKVTFETANNLYHVLSKKPNIALNPLFFPHLVHRSTMNEVTRQNGLGKTLSFQKYIQEKYTGVLTEEDIRFLFDDERFLKLTDQHGLKLVLQQNN